ncbi:MAG: 2-oxoacid:ferredoxin oxidoreductase subunit beta [Defluviitaleaceae bacterium]|nr:2-oxoacid:ferredoxin oxidoreductase subunit beta [Defluviitaleaceae bacterium]
MSSWLNYLRTHRFPHIWCAGCGNGTVINAMARAAEDLKLNKDKTSVVSGIGCSSRGSGYLDCCTLHTTHGRALPFATGLKFANPELEVLVVSGDGDATAIGGNHFIHAARRNIDLTLVIMNNNIYGMTSGQYSPLTPTGALATTAPYGNIDRTFDICKLAEASGATYVARATSYHVSLLKKCIENGIKNKGFSVIEVLTQCPTYFGRRNKIGNAPQMLRWYKDRGVLWKPGTKEDPDKIYLGEFVNVTDSEYCESYEAVIEKAGGKK